MIEITIGGYTYTTEKISSLKAADIQVDWSGRRFILQDIEGTPHELIYNDLLAGVLDSQLSFQEMNPLLEKLVSLRTTGYEDLKNFSCLKRTVIAIKQLWGKFRQDQLITRAELCGKSKEELVKALTRYNPSLKFIPALDTLSTPDDAQALFFELKCYLAKYPGDLLIWRALYAKTLGSEDFGVVNFDGKGRLPLRVAQMQSQTISNMTAGLGGAQTVPVKIRSHTLNLEIKQEHIQAFTTILENEFTFNQTPILNDKNAFHVFALADYFHVPWLQEACKKFILATQFDRAFIQNIYIQLNTNSPRPDTKDLSPLPWLLNYCIGKLLPKGGELLKLQFEPFLSQNPADHPFLLKMLLTLIKGHIKYDFPQMQGTYPMTNEFFILRQAERQVFGNTTLTDEMVTNALDSSSAINLVNALLKHDEIKETDPFYQKIHEVCSKNGRVLHKLANEQHFKLI